MLYATNDSVIVTVQDVNKSFGKNHALKNLNLQISAGKITGLAGPDGAGKTTLIRLLTGLMQPDTGAINVLGYDSKREALKIQSEIGYMPQQFGLYTELSVLENLSLYAKLKNMPPEKQAARFDELLRLTDLKRFSDRLAGKLSGGMKQKLGLCCALLTKPRLLLLDEPGVGVDPLSRLELWGLVADLTKEGVGVLWSTAYLDEAENCDETILLNNGQLLFQGPPADFTTRVNGRVYLIKQIENRRKYLRKFLKHPLVMDGSIQGMAIRLVVKEKVFPADLRQSLESRNALITPITPRFEDAFIDFLGGVESGESKIAAATSLLAGQENEIIIEAKDLTKKFGSFIAANNISFNIKRGEIFGLLGPNGAGKSTTFKMLCGLLQPDAGYSKIIGYDFQKYGSFARTQLGYMAQKFSLYNDLTVKQNLNFFAGIYGLNFSKRRYKVAMMLELFELEKYKDSTTKSLPLGLKQRLALAAALMHEPKALFLDEPTSGIDPIARREFWMHINGLVEKGVTILVTTHFMDEAEYCDRIALIYRGHTIALDTPDNLKSLVKQANGQDVTMEESFIQLIRKDEERLRNATSQ